MSCKLFLGGLAPVTSKEALEAHFGQYGTITDAVVMYKEGRSRGFGFVSFDTPEAMQMVLSCPQVIDGRTIDVKDAVPQSEAPPPQNGFGGGMEGYSGEMAGKGGSKGGGKGAGSGGKVFIGGLTQNTDEEMVREYFSRYGNLIDLVVMKDRMTGKSRGFGFVTYDDESCVDAVIAEYSNHQLDGKWVEVKSAVSRDALGPSKGMFGKGCSKGGGFKGAYGVLPAYGGGAYGGPPAYGGGAYGGGYGPPQQQFYQFDAPCGGKGGCGPPCGGKGGYRARPY